MRFANISRLFAVFALLALGGCGMPVAVQIVSLLADGVSLLATEKSVSDHGLSALTDQDCALWRGLKGEAVCQDSDTVPVVLANREPPNRSESASPPEAPPAVETLVVEDNFSNAPVGGASAAANNEPPVIPIKSWIVAVETTEPLEAPAVPQAPQSITRTRQSSPSYAHQSGGYYYVIASYFRPADAERFAGRHPSLTPIVLSGTAKGRRVYRVAVGPLIKGRRPTVRAKLIDVGIRDAWGLTLNAPTVVTELAAVD